VRHTGRLLRHTARLAFRQGIRLVRAPCHILYTHIRFRLRIHRHPCCGNFADCYRLACLPSLLLAHHGHHGLLHEVLVLLATPTPQLVQRSA
jgi:hypothetical protein